MRFDEGTILGIYPDLFTLAVARNCLAFVRLARCARVCTCIYLGAASFPRRSPENPPERTSRHLARVPLGVLADVVVGVFARRAVGSANFTGFDTRARNRIAPSNSARKIEHIVAAIPGRLLTILLLQAVGSQSNVGKYYGDIEGTCNGPPGSILSSSYLWIDREYLAEMFREIISGCFVCHCCFSLPFFISRFLRPCLTPLSKQLFLLRRIARLRSFFFFEIAKYLRPLRVDQSKLLHFNTRNEYCQAVNSP